MASRPARSKRDASGPGHGHGRNEVRNVLDDVGDLHSEAAQTTVQFRFRFEVLIGLFRDAQIEHVSTTPNSIDLSRDPVRRTSKGHFHGGAEDLAEQCVDGVPVDVGLAGQQSPRDGR